MASLRELVFVSARGQNLYFDELTDALRHELEAIGLTTGVSVDELPPSREGMVSVIVGPHEFAALSPSRRRLRASRMRRTIAVCTEQPGTAWHELGARVAAIAGAAFDINRRGVRALHGLGVRARHLQLGYTEHWRREPAAERDVDICFLGGATPRRQRYLASYADELWRHRCRLVLSDNRRPSAVSGPSFVGGEQKLSLLARSRVLLNLHRDDRAYFEWQRILEAIHCGAAVVSEHSTDFGPLEPGEHFMVGQPEALHLIASTTLEDEERRSAIAASALDLVRAEIPMRHAAEELAGSAESLLGRRPMRLPHAPVRLGPRPVERRLRDVLSPLRRPDGQSAELRAAIKQTRIEMIELDRRVGALAVRVERGVVPPVEIAARSTAYEGATPGVSVIVPAFDQAAHLAAALDSVAAQREPGVELELVVVDDGSNDDSLAIARDWIGRHPQLPAVLLRHAANRGLPATRNTATATARAELILPLDSDNLLLPNAVARLHDALRADPDAAFAYGILACFSEDGPEELEGYFGWEPMRLAEANYIDALALVRRSVLEELGGFTTDRRLYGWEDYDLWCRIAERGMHGAHVPEIVARYRVADGSMISLTNLSDTEARRALEERSPGVFAAGAW